MSNTVAKTATAFDEVIKRYYPNAVSGRQLTVDVLYKLSRECPTDRILFGTSLCADDINVPSTSFSSQLFGPFKFGGLGGLPFAGVTGMVAYSHHIPDEGMAFIYYGPHIGVTLDGRLGKMYRPGQTQASSSCGALMLALNRLGKSNGDGHRSQPEENDYQQAKLEASVAPFRERILNSDNPAREITDVTYENIDRMLREYMSAAKKEFPCEKIALLGGIIINTDPGFDDYVDVRNFEFVNVKDL
jgi:hypothetical protein